MFITFLVVSRETLSEKLEKKFGRKFFRAFLGVCRPKMLIKKCPFLVLNAKMKKRQATFQITYKIVE